MQLTKERFATLTREYSGFHDAVVSAVSVSIAQGVHRCSAKILARRSDDSNLWDALEFEFHHIAAYRFEYGRRTYEVLSEGVQVFWTESGLLVVFDVADASMTDAPDLEQNLAFVKAKSCSVSIEPHRV